MQKPLFNTPVRELKSLRQADQKAFDAEFMTLMSAKTPSQVLAWITWLNNYVSVYVTAAEQATVTVCYVWQEVRKVWEEDEEASGTYEYKKPFAPRDPAWLNRLSKDPVASSIAVAVDGVPKDQVHTCLFCEGQFNKLIQQ